MDNALDSDSKDCRFDPGRAGQHCFAAVNNPPLAVRPITLCRRGRQFCCAKPHYRICAAPTKRLCRNNFFMAVREIKNPFSQEDGFLICIIHYSLFIIYLMIIKRLIPIPLLKPAVTRRKNLYLPFPLFRSASSAKCSSFLRFCYPFVCGMR